MFNKTGAEKVIVLYWMSIALFFVVKYDEKL